MPISEKVELGNFKIQNARILSVEKQLPRSTVATRCLLLCSWSLRPLMSLFHTWCQIFGRWNQLNLRDHQMGHWWSHNSLTETGNGMRGQKLKAAWAKAESQATPEENVSRPQTLESRAALSPLRRRNSQIVFVHSP